MHTHDIYIVKNKKKVVTHTFIILFLFIYIPHIYYIIFLDNEISTALCQRGLQNP